MSFKISRAKVVRNFASAALNQRQQKVVVFPILKVGIGVRHWVEIEPRHNQRARCLPRVAVVERRRRCGRRWIHRPGRDLGHFVSSVHRQEIEPVVHRGKVVGVASGILGVCVILERCIAVVRHVPRHLRGVSAAVRDHVPPVIGAVWSLWRFGSKLTRLEFNLYARDAICVEKLDNANLTSVHASPAWHSGAFLILSLEDRKAYRF